MKTELCTRCGEALRAGREAWLELNTLDNTYHDPTTDPVPADESQGGFPFGRACAKRILENGGGRK